MKNASMNRQPAPDSRRIRTTNARYRSSSPGATDLLAPFLLYPTDSLPSQPCDLRQIFARNAPHEAPYDAPYILDIGFGKGEALAALAAANPDTDFVGCELFAPGLTALARQASAAGLRNLRLALVDARDLLHSAIAPQSLTAINLFFPDPWPKRRHHHRRLVQPDFCALAHSRLKPGGIVHTATDWRDYADWMLAQFQAAGGWQVLTSAEGKQRTGDRPPSRFELRGRQAGRNVTEHWFEKTPA